MSISDSFALVVRLAGNHVIKASFFLTIQRCVDATAFHVIITGSKPHLCVQKNNDFQIMQFLADFAPFP